MRVSALHLNADCTRVGVGIMLTLSVVVPVYAGETYLNQLQSEIAEIRNRWRNEEAPIRISELILVNDSARDSSPAIVDQMARESDWIVALHLSRNFGQHPATIAGILHSSGDWVVTMDEDLQHSPGRISEMLQIACGEGADVVYGKAESPVHENGFRDYSSKLSKRVIEYLSGNPDITKASSFRLIRGSIARAAASVCGHDTYFDVAISWFSQRIQVVRMEMKDERFIRTGRSGYKWTSLLSHGRRLVFSSQLKVLRLALLLGFVVASLAVIGVCMILLLRLISPAAIGMQGWTSLFLSICFFGGFGIFLTGVLLEYMSVLVLRAHGKPLFFTVDRSSDVEIDRYFLLNVNRPG